MNQHQIGILNGLVTYAAENVPGGLSEDEQAVARIVGGWALNAKEMARIRYIPIFVGITDEEEKIVIYQSRDSPRELHIKRPDGMLWALSPMSTVEWQHDKMGNHIHLKLTSEAWSGEAVGTPVDVVTEPPIRFY